MSRDIHRLDMGGSPSNRVKPVESPPFLWAEGFIVPHNVSEVRKRRAEIV